MEVICVMLQLRSEARRAPGESTVSTGCRAGHRLRVWSTTTAPRGPQRTVASVSTVASTALEMALSTADWVVLAVYIVASVCVGLYPDIARWWKGRRAPVLDSGGADHEVFARKFGASEDGEGSIVDEYLLASRSMGAFAVGVSVTAALTSGITMLGGPGYSYEKGLAILFSQLSYFVATPLTAFVFLPFFNGLGVTTAYEYLEVSAGSDSSCCCCCCCECLTYTYTAWCCS